MQVQSEHVRGALGAAALELGGAVARGKSMLEGVPPLDSETGEAAFRKHMVAESEALAALNQALESALSGVDLLQKAVKHDALPTGIEEVTQEGRELAALSFYYVSLFAALSLFRNPFKTQEAAKKLSQVVQRIDQLPPRPHWPGASWLQEMRTSAAAQVAADAAGALKRKGHMPESATQAPQKRGRAGAARGRGRGAPAAAEASGAAGPGGK